MALACNTVILIVLISQFQAAWILFSKHRHLKHFANLSGDNASWWKAGIGVAACTVVGLVLIKIFSFQRR